GAGTPLSYGVLTVAGGALRLSPMQSIADLAHPPAGVTLDPDMARVWGPFSPGRTWENVDLTGRFPVAAELASRMWQAIGKPAVDGVLLVDPVALKPVLAATGPVTVDGASVTADNVVDNL